jgi:chemotaxis protein methyltransferase CheR
LDAVLDNMPIELEILGTDFDQHLLGRARAAIYPESSIRDLPRSRLDHAFDQQEKGWQLLQEYRRNVRFERQDIRNEVPEGPFDFILCRNLAFTYFDPELQLEVLSRIESVVSEDGRLAIGNREVLPEEARDWLPVEQLKGLYRLQTNASSVVMRKP